MVTKVNPLNQNTFLDLSEAVAELEPTYGYIDSSGILKSKALLPTNTVIKS